MFKKSFALGVMLTAVFLLVLSAGAQTVKTKQVKIQGYITNIISPTSFEIDDLKVKRDESLVLSFENQDPSVQFKPEDLRVGTAVEIQGQLNAETNELKATKVTIDLEQFRKLNNTTILNRTPEGIEKTEAGWKGVFWADGRKIKIEPTTQVLFELNKSEKKAADAEAKAKSKKDDKNSKAEDDDEFANSEPLKAITDVKAGMFATYEGIEQPDGSVLASRIIFVKNELEKDEAEFWKSLKLTEKAPNFMEGSAGELKVEKVGKFKLLPNKEVQDYVQRLGQSLIPAYQKALPDDDPLKINFRFYVINDKEPNAFALANGVVVMHSGMIMMLENEAQLASILAHEISHATQEHTWRQLNKDKGKRTALMVGIVAASIFAPGAGTLLNMTLAAMVNGYSRRLEDQADRIGLEYMTAAGYDPREAPRVWKIMSKKYGDMPNTFFWSSHSNNATRRSYLMVEIRNNYAGLDLNNMKRGDAGEYEKIAALTKEASAKKKKGSDKIKEADKN